MNVARAFLLTAVLLSLPQILLGQGNLTPPVGIPAPTMKSLDQIEARTLIAALPFTISTGGSYYLTKSLSVTSGDAITIAASGVTLDLNGFEITSTESSPSHSGISISSGLANIRIMNGQIRGNVSFNGSTFSGSGFANGILATGTSPLNATISHISVAGCLSAGIDLGFAGLVESCSLNTIGNTGIRAATVIYSNIDQCGSVGITAINVTGCSVKLTSSGDTGIGGQTVTACTAMGHINSGEGAIRAEMARDCYAYASSGDGDGVLAYTAENCEGIALAAGSGIHVYRSALTCVGQAGGSGIGVNVGGTALNCYGFAGSGSGVSALSAENCYGVSNNAGITATNATNCYGSNVGPIGDSINGFGINANTATGCYGVSVGSIGLQAKTAINCTGTTGSGGTGIYGINTSTAQNCYGINTGSTNAFGMRAIIASFSYGTGSSIASGGGGISAASFAYGSYGTPLIAGPSRYFCQPNPTYP